jgi:dihydroxyacetone kinase-like protein
VSRASELATAVAAGLAQVSAQLNELDSFAGDGDLGLTVGTGCAAVLELLPGLATAPPGELMRRIGVELSTRAPSTAGTLAAFALIAAGRETTDREPAWDAGSLARILRVVTTTVGTRGRSAPGDKTMLDALEPAAAAAESAAAAGVPLVAAAESAAAAASAGAEGTSAMSPKHGRASWLAGRSVGHEDAGARAVAIVLALLAEALEPDITRKVG